MIQWRFPSCFTSFSALISRQPTRQPTRQPKSCPPLRSNTSSLCFLAANCDGSLAEAGPRATELTAAPREPSRGGTVPPRPRGGTVPPRPGTAAETAASASQPFQPANCRDAMDTIDTLTTMVDDHGRRPWWGGVNGECNGECNGENTLLVGACRCAPPKVTQQQAVHKYTQVWCPYQALPAHGPARDSWQTVPDCLRVSCGRTCRHMGGGESEKTR